MSTSVDQDETVSNSSFNQGLYCTFLCILKKPKYRSICNYVYRWLLSTSVDPNQMLNNSPSIINQGPYSSLLISTSTKYSLPNKYRRFKIRRNKNLEQCRPRSHNLLVKTYCVIKIRVINRIFQGY